MAAKTEKGPDYYVAIEGFTTMINGRREFFYAGRSIVAADHPVLRIRPKAFRPQQVSHGTVEQTTAAPGETR